LLFSYRYCFFVGTGKTNTGIKLIYLYNEINKLRYEDEGGVRQKVLFCGPSNKSVDLVASKYCNLLDI